MSASVCDFMKQRLHAWGVRRAFGYRGNRISRKTP